MSIPTISSIMVKHHLMLLNSVMLKGLIEQAAEKSLNSQETLVEGQQVRF